MNPQKENSQMIPFKRPELTKEITADAYWDWDLNGRNHEIVIYTGKNNPSKPKTFDAKTIKQKIFSAVSTNGVFVCAHTVDPSFTPAPGKGKGVTDKHIVSARKMVFDFDAGKEVLPETFCTEPTVIFESSPGSYWVEFELAEPTKDMALFSSFIKWYGKEFIKADRKVLSLRQIMRAVGTKHGGDHDQDYTAKLRYFNPGARTYTLEQWIEFHPEFSEYIEEQAKIAKQSKEEADKWLANTEFDPFDQVIWRSNLFRIYSDMLRKSESSRAPFDITVRLRESLLGCGLSNDGVEELMTEAAIAQNESGNIRNGRDNDYKRNIKGAMSLMVEADPYWAMRFSGLKTGAEIKASENVKAEILARLNNCFAWNTYERKFWNVGADMRASVDMVQAQSEVWGIKYVEIENNDPKSKDEKPFVFKLTSEVWKPQCKQIYGCVWNPEKPPLDYFEEKGETFFNSYEGHTIDGVADFEGVVKFRRFLEKAMGPEHALTFENDAKQSMQKPSLRKRIPLLYGTNGTGKSSLAEVMGAVMGKLGKANKRASFNGYLDKARVVLYDEIYCDNKHDFNELIEKYKEDWIDRSVNLKIEGLASKTITPYYWPIACTNHIMSVDLVSIKDRIYPIHMLKHDEPYLLDEILDNDNYLLAIREWLMSEPYVKAPIRQITNAYLELIDENEEFDPVKMLYDKLLRFNSNKFEYFGYELQDFIERSCPRWSYVKVMTACGKADNKFFIKKKSSKGMIYSLTKSEDYEESEF